MTSSEPTLKELAEKLRKALIWGEATIPASYPMGADGRTTFEVISVLEALASKEAEQTTLQIKLVPVHQRFGACGRCGNRIEGELIDCPTVELRVVPKQIIPIDLCRSCAATIKVKPESEAESKKRVEEVVKKIEEHHNKLEELYSTAEALDWVLALLTTKSEERLTLMHNFPKAIAGDAQCSRCGKWWSDLKTDQCEGSESPTASRKTTEIGGDVAT